VGGREEDISIEGRDRGRDIEDRDIPIESDSERESGV
jgi:hypothetical protein